MAEYEYQNGKIVGVKVNGKPVMKSYLNALVKAQETPYWKLAPGAMLINGYELTKEEASIVLWAKNWERRYQMAGGNPKAGGTTLQTFDNVRYLFLKLNPNAFEDLLH